MLNAWVVDDRIYILLLIGDSEAEEVMKKLCLFPLFPEAVLAPPAFMSELMALTVYQQIDGVLDDILDDEPEARERVRALLREVTTDELAHVGQRHNFLGPIGLRAAHLMVESMYRAFFRDISETKLLFMIGPASGSGVWTITSAPPPLAPTMIWARICQPIRYGATTTETTANEMTAIR